MQTPLCPCAASSLASWACQQPRHVLWASLAGRRGGKYPGRYCGVRDFLAQDGLSAAQSVTVDQRGDAALISGCMWFSAMHGMLRLEGQCRVSKT